MGREDDWLVQAARHHRRGDLNAALQLCRKVLTARPDHPAGLALAARLHLDGGDARGALPLLRRALAGAPDHPDLHLRAGQALKALGLVEEAMRHLRRAVALRPDMVDAHREIGELALANRRAGEAVHHLQRVAAARPDDWAAAERLGRACQLAGRAEAVAAFEHAVALAPARRDLRLRLVAAMTEFGQGPQAAPLLADLAAGPEGVAAYRDLAALLLEQYQYRAALDAALAALERDAADDASRFVAALACESLGEFAAARDHYAAVRAPDRRERAANNRLFTTCYDPDLTPDDVRTAHAAWGGAFQAAAPAARPHDNGRDPDRPLRVGYLSPDFRKHPVSAFLASVIAYHHPGRVIAHCYANVAEPDEVTHALRQVCPRWRDVTGWTDAEVAGRIRADGIDILVELAGLSGANRLRVLAHRPAPVQVSYLGYPATTGLPSVDYRVTDAVANPPGSERYYTERLARLPGGFCCYLPPPNAPEPGPLPAAAAGHVTFASLVNLKKVNERTVALWARVLQAVPGARLALVRHTLRPEANRRRWREAFARHGIGAERLDLVWELPEQGGYLDHYRRVDVVLDTLPFCGHTSACEALWMGVPVLTLEGEDFAGRMVASVLGMAGLADWVAGSEADFVRVAAAVAGDVDGLARLRAGLRARMAASPLLAAEPFTRSLEASYREMWRAWCAAGRRVAPDG